MCFRKIQTVFYFLCSAIATSGQNTPRLETETLTRLKWTRIIIFGCSKSHAICFDENGCYTLAAGYEICIRIKNVCTCTTRFICKAGMIPTGRVNNKQKGNERTWFGSHKSDFKLIYRRELRNWLFLQCHQAGMFISPTEGYLSHFPALQLDVGESLETEEHL